MNLNIYLWFVWIERCKTSLWMRHDVRKKTVRGAWLVRCFVNKFAQHFAFVRCEKWRVFFQKSRGIEPFERYRERLACWLTAKMQSVHWHRQRIPIEAQHFNLSKLKLNGGKQRKFIHSLACSWCTRCTCSLKRAFVCNYVGCILRWTKSTSIIQWCDALAQIV